MEANQHERGPVVGIDASKEHLEAGALPGGQEWGTGQGPEGVSALAGRIATLQPALAVLEATGGLEWAFVAALIERGVSAQDLRNRAGRRDAVQARFQQPAAQLAPAPGRVRRVQLRQPRLHGRRCLSRAAPGAPGTIRQHLTRCRPCHGHGASATMAPRPPTRRRPAGSSPSHPSRRP